MPIIAQIYEKAKEKNIISGIIIGDLITFIAYVIFPSGLVFVGDFQMIIGVLIGVFFGLSNKKKPQSEIRLGLMIGILGALFAAFSLSMFEWILYTIFQGFSSGALLFFFSFFMIEALVIGFPLGFLSGFYFYRKNRRIILKSKIDEDFYRSLE